MLETVIAIALSPIAIVGGIFSLAFVYGVTVGIAKAFIKKHK